MFASGFALGLIVLYLGVARPLMAEFARIQRQMGDLERGVQKLAGQTEQAAKTSELLGGARRTGAAVARGGRRAWRKSRTCRPN